MNRRSATKVVMRWFEDETVKYRETTLKTALEKSHCGQLGKNRRRQAAFERRVGWKMQKLPETTWE